MDSKIFRADLHLHTHYSYDSFASPEKIFLRAKSVGLSAVAVTDHNTVRGWKPMLEASRKHGIPVVLGEEVRVAGGGEVLGFFLTEAVKSADPSEVIDAIKAQGGIAAIPHPFDSWRQALPRPELFTKRVHVIEALNARTDAEHNAMAAAFAAKHRLGSTGGSDAHSAGEVGTAWTEANATDLDAFRKALQNKSTSAKGGLSPKSVRVFSTLAKVRPWRP